MIVAAAVVDIFDLLPRRSPRNIEACREYSTAAARQQWREVAAARVCYAAQAVTDARASRCIPKLNVILVGWQRPIAGAGSVGGG
jgi:hypothetical protein